jgi:glycosyltransferase involved in cell wall biosynthesis
MNWQKKIMESEKISVIIPTRNRPQDAINCLKSISIQTHPPDEVIIADSSDTEDLKFELDSLSLFRFCSFVLIFLNLIHTSHSSSSSRRYTVR